MERPGDKNTRRPAAEINVRRGRARRLGDGAPFTPRLTYWRLVLVYAQMPWHASIYNVSYQRSGRRASHNWSAAIGDGGEKSRSDLRDGVRWAWAKPSEDAITTSNARMASDAAFNVSLVSRVIRVSCAAVGHSRIPETSLTAK